MDKLTQLRVLARCAEIRIAAEDCRDTARLTRQRNRGIRLESLSLRERLWTTGQQTLSGIRAAKKLRPAKQEVDSQPSN